MNPRRRRIRRIARKRRKLEAHVRMLAAQHIAELAAGPTLSDI